MIMVLFDRENFLIGEQDAVVFSVAKPTQKCLTLLIAPQLLSVSQSLRPQQLIWWRPNILVAIRRTVEWLTLSSLAIRRMDRLLFRLILVFKARRTAGVLTVAGRPDLARSSVVPVSRYRVTIRWIVQYRTSNSLLISFVPLPFRCSATTAARNCSLFICVESPSSFQY